MPHYTSFENFVKTVLVRLTWTNGWIIIAFRYRLFIGVRISSSTDISWSFSSCSWTIRRLRNRKVSLLSSIGIRSPQAASLHFTPLGGVISLSRLFKFSGNTSFEQLVTKTSHLFSDNLLKLFRHEIIFTTI